jgi:hypothetical protein
MKIYLKEKIRNPSLFTGRIHEIHSLLKWIDRISEELSKSKALISRRKTGKSALMQRLFNIVFEKNGRVIPFYYELREADQWFVDFSKDFFFTFIYQYIAFKSRNTEYFLRTNDGFEKTIYAAEKEKQNHLINYIESLANAEALNNYDIMWNIAREAPRMIVQHHDERAVQMIDEFQFLNHYIHWDIDKQRRAKGFAGSYLHTAEYKNAPLLVSGSWIGWLLDDLNKLLPARFIIEDFQNMPKHEAIAMALNYSEIEEVPVTYETACLIAELTDGNPFYISSLFQSNDRDKDFSTRDGIIKTLNFETLDKRGIIKGTWMEYILTAIHRVNDLNGKKIILYLCKHKNQERTRQEIINDLNLDISDSNLEKRLKAFVRSDIISQGTTGFDYQAIDDHIFDKVFRGVYQKEIDGFDPRQIKNDYKRLYEQLKGRYNKYKGEYSEYVIMTLLKHRAYKNNALFLSMINHVPADFKFVSYESVWTYTTSLIYNKTIQLDIFARAKPNDYSIIGEVKNRKQKFSKKEAALFLEKAKAVKKLEKITKVLYFVFSSSGFYQNTIAFFKHHSIAWSDDPRFLNI